MSAHRNLRTVATAQPPPVAGRMPPHDLDAEAAVLSALLLDAGRVDEVGGWLRPEHFYSDANSRIYEAVVALREQRRPIDVVTVASYLRERERLAQVGGPSYLAVITDATPAVAHVAHHAATVVDHSTTRRIVATCQRVAAEGYGNIGDAREWAAGAVGAVAAAADDASPTEATSARDGVRELADEYAHPERRIAIGTGLRVLDDMIDGLQPGKLVLVGAHSSHGKSALALQVAVHVALEETCEEQPCGAIYYSLEMSRKDLLRRAACSLAGFSARRLRGNITDDQGRAFVAALNRLAVDHLQIPDRAGVSIDDIRLSAARHAAALRRSGTPLRVVVIDYAQLVQPSTTRRGGTREEEVAQIGRGAKLLAADLGCAVILLSQLNAESIKEKRLPRSTDLRESKGLTNDADAVILAWNPAVLERQAGSVPPPDEATVDEAKLVAGKVRDGAVGVAQVGYRPALTRFEDLPAWG